MPITDRTVSLCQGLIAEHSDNIGRLSAIFRQQHPSGKVMTSQGDLKPGAAFLCSQITNTYTVPPPWCLPCHGKMSTERFQRRHNKTVIDTCGLLRQQFCLVFCKDANRKIMWCHNRPFVTFHSIFSYVQCKCCQKYIYKCSKKEEFHCIRETRDR